MQQGWIKLHRQIRDHWLFEEERSFSKFEAWVDLLMEVNHCERSFLLGNEVLELKAGQTVTSIRKLCEKWGWSNSKVTQFFKLLQSEGMITYKSDTKKTVITIDKYEIYQHEVTEKTTLKRHEGDAKKTRKHTNNNYNQFNNDRELQINNSPKQASNAVHYELSEYLYNLILSNNPEYKKPNLEAWCKPIRLMIEKDGRTPERIREVIKFAQSNNFWWKNILSTEKLRKQYDTLSSQMRADSSKVTLNRQRGSLLTPSLETLKRQAENILTEEELRQMERSVEVMPF